MTALLQQLNGDMSAVIEEVGRSLVHISNGDGAGAGTVWHSEGLIVTNAHVIAGRRGLKVTLPDGRILPAKVLAQDDENDLAALSVDATGLATIEPGDSRRVQAGEWVMAMGHPWGVAGAVTAGVVIGLESGWPDSEARTVGPARFGGITRDLIAVSLKLRPGHSGGPLVNVHGKLIGINTLMAGLDIGAAIPAHSVKAFLKESLGS